MKLYKRILITLSVGFIIYLLGAFAAASFDITTWAPSMRTGVSLQMGIIMASAFGLTFTESINQP